ncbi:hypothetical protein [uncultured Aquimarina sp.]|uniref:hypothetical protein n=1 Tax=uncultured Aquimarina sp. TaxID=575652 RepID=UPI00261915EB|nr:hypothetical protein [uncultured Aquimarina sp.]
MTTKTFYFTIITVISLISGISMFAYFFSNKSEIIVKDSANNFKDENVKNKSLDISPEKINNNDSYPFYKFTKMTYRPQPPNSQWCWAACLEQMIKGLNPPSTIGKEQCDIVQYYWQNYTTEQTRTLRMNRNETCCTGQNEFNKKCKDLSLDPIHLENVFQKAGFKCNLVYDFKQKLQDYKFIRKTLIDNDSPIILKTNRGSGAHLEMISGFGKKDDFEYVLISNPYELYNEKYYSIDCFFSDYKNILKEVWISEVKPTVSRNKNLNLDKDLIEIYNKIEKTINEEKNKNNVNWNIKFDNPFFFLKAHSLLKSPVALDQDYDLETKNRKEIISNSAQSNTVTNCLADSPLGIDQIGGLNGGFLGEITDLTEKIINNDYSFNITPIDKIYLEEYAITLRKRIQNEKIQLKPISYPSDYQIESKWLSHEELNLRLESLNKIKSFKN